MVTSTTTFEHSTIETNGVRLHVVQAGPTDGEPVLLLHGFPDFWYGWRDQIEALAAAGFRVVAPDQRGYNLSDVPEGMMAYRVDALVTDALGLMDALGHEQFALGGHDWGAVVSWYTAIWHPQRLTKLIIANVPHPVAYQQALRSSFEQIAKSWYVGFFQIPQLPEMLLSANDYAGVINALKQSGLENTFTEEDFVAYRKAYTNSGGITGMLNWYRALLWRQPQTPEDAKVTVPTLMLWGKKDPALSWEMAEPSIDQCEDGQLVLFEEASHWVLRDKSQRCSELMIEFLKHGMV